MYETPLWQKAAVDAYFSLLSSTHTMPYQNTTTTKRAGGDNGGCSSTGKGYPYGKYNPRGRGYPDVALLGVKYITAINGSFYPLDGTSASAPVIAALISLANSARIANGQPTLGFLNPALYLLAHNPLLGIGGQNRRSRQEGTSGSVGVEEEGLDLDRQSRDPTPTDGPKQEHEHDLGGRVLGKRGERVLGTGETVEKIVFNRDVTVGSNKCTKGVFPMTCCQHGFPASVGWDPVTG